MSTEALLVVGPHRSGTSAAARVLSLVGGSLPPNLMEPVPGVNETGFWESRTVSDLGDVVLARAGLAWNSVAPWPDGWDPAVDAKGELDEATAWLRSVLREGAPVVLKDPRISRLLPFWRLALERAGALPRILVCLRHPLEVAGSLVRRDDLDEEIGVAIWLRSLLEAEVGSRDADRVAAWYPLLLEDPENWLRVVHEAWGRPVPEHSPERLREFLRVDLRHHEHEGIDYGGRGGWYALAAEVHAALLGVPDLNAARPLFDRVRNEVETVDGVVGRSLRAMESRCRDRVRIVDAIEVALSSESGEEAAEDGVEAVSSNGSVVGRAQVAARGIREIVAHCRKLEQALGDRDRDLSEVRRGYDEVANWARELEQGTLAERRAREELAARLGEEERLGREATRTIATLEESLEAERELVARGLDELETALGTVAAPSTPDRPPEPTRGSRLDGLVAEARRIREERDRLREVITVLRRIPGARAAWALLARLRARRRVGSGTIRRP